jgi:hypothetical protein
MQRVVIAVEGSIPDGATAHWGTAALQEGDELVNPITGRRSHISRVEPLIKEGHLTRLPRPIPVPAHVADSGMVVLIIRRADRFAPYLERVESGRAIQQVAQKSTTDFSCRLFATLAGFDAYANIVIGDLIARVLGASQPEPEIAEEMLQLGSALDSSHPILNAVRACRTKDEVMAACYRARVRGEARLTQFDEFHRALAHPNSEHHLRYRGGLAEGGGLELSAAMRMMTAVKTTYKAAGDEIRKALSCFSQSMDIDLRLYMLTPSSADFMFRAGEGETELERVARNLALTKVVHYLSGDRPTDEKASRRVKKAVRALVELNDLRPVEHGADINNLRDVAAAPREDADTGDVEICELSLFGFVGGISKRARLAELYLGAKATKSVKVPTHSDGDGGTPRVGGWDGYLWRPAIIRVRRERTADSIAFHAQSLNLIEDGDDVVVDAIPSSVALNAYLTDITLPLSRRGDILKTPHGDISLGPLVDQTAAEMWYGAYCKVAKRFELDVAMRPQSIKCAPPLHPPIANEGEQLLVGVDATGGDSGFVPQESVVEYLRMHVRITLQENNILRPSQARASTSEWFERNVPERTIRLTPEGKARLRLFHAFGGSLPGAAAHGRGEEPTAH